MKNKNVSALEDPEVREAMERVFSENKEGMETLKNEELAEQRRNETVVGRYLRIAKRKLGLRKSGAQVIQLS